MALPDLEEAWRQFQDRRFPPVQDPDLKVDLVDYDGFIAGIVSRVATGGEIPPQWRSSFQFDEELARRARELEEAAAVDYLNQLRPLIELAKRVDADRERQSA